MKRSTSRALASEGIDETVEPQARRDALPGIMLRQSLEFIDIDTDKCPYMSIHWDNCLLDLATANRLRAA